MADPIIQQKLDDLFERTPVREIDAASKIVVFSDLHMGNGGGTDDFVRNSELFATVLKRSFADRGYTVVLNGDIEDLYRFRLSRIIKHWNHVYEIFRDLQKDNRFIKIVGNHDYELYSLAPRSYPFRLVPAVRFNFEGGDIFVLHGHQATNYFERWNAFSAFLLRCIANPLKIRSRTVSRNSAKKFRTELRIYEFAARRKIITLIGHTHRPLFESHSKIDELRFKIENQMRSWEHAGSAERNRIEEEVSEYKRELTKLYDKGDTRRLGGALYNQLVVPALFNSGCAIGKRGITGLEIADGAISLVHWFDRDVSVQHLSDGKNGPQRIDGTGFYRTVLQSESLQYIFARIRLLV
ncbi:MAG: metallophosphoesterase family protein [Spirochaetales bacterium]|nr:metallophosphoesterase family protein [Spirochaetales bacterium]